MPLKITFDDAIGILLAVYDHVICMTDYAYIQCKAAQRSME